VRSRRTGRTSTVGDTSIEWRAVPRVSGVLYRNRADQNKTSTSAAAVRSSFLTERPHGSLREVAEVARVVARRASEVLGVDDLAQVRRSMRTIG
jgi:hypothetical protein